MCHICQNKVIQCSSLMKQIRCHEDVDVCSEYPKCYYIAGELKHHEPVHSDFKPFCCGLCGKAFKRKDAVLRHFQRCSDRLI